MIHDHGDDHIITPQQALTEHQEKLRRLRKPTTGEIEDVFNHFATTMLQQYGPLAVAITELNHRLSRLEDRLANGGDIE